MIFVFQRFVFLVLLAVLKLDPPNPQGGSCDTSHSHIGCNRYLAVGTEHLRAYGWQAETDHQHRRSYLRSGLVAGRVRYPRWLRRPSTHVAQTLGKEMAVGGDYVLLGTDRGCP